jgi:hypothetical protein
MRSEQRRSTAHCEEEKHEENKHGGEESGEERWLER